MGGTATATRSGTAARTEETTSVPKPRAGTDGGAETRTAGDAATTAATAGTAAEGAGRRFRGARSGVQRTAERAYGLLILTRLLAVSAVVLLLLVAAGWSTVRGVEASVLSSRQRGTLTVASCDGSTCRGAFAPGPRTVTITEAALTRGQAKPGARVGVALLPHETEAVRTGVPGLLHALLPFGGALMLGALITGGVLRLRRTTWAFGLLGVMVVLGAFTVSV